MKSIYCSKLYKSSPRKDKIRAAMKNPLNAPLVKQLEEYLDDKYIDIIEFEDSKDAVSDNSNDSAADSSSVDQIPGGPDSAPESSGQSSSNNFGEGSGSSISDKVVDELEDDAADDILDSDDSSESTEEDDLDNANSSTSVSSNSLSGLSYVNKSSILSNASYDTKLQLSPLEVAGILNSNSDTAGVMRTSVNDNEFWVYYNDKLNLNNVMGPAIVLLDSSSHSQLRFNRLARSDNAIVFDILEQPEYESNKSITEVIDEQK